jgi:hypothetical protein
MSINVVVVGGPSDGVEMIIDDGCAYVHAIEACAPDLRPQLDPAEATGISINKVMMPVRRTRYGYRCYWSERA